MPQPRTRPIQKLANAMVKCTAEASVYGKCVIEDYNNVHKDKCLNAFLSLKECVMAASKKV